MTAPGNIQTVVIRKAATGDTDAKAWLYNQYSRAMFNICIRMTGHVPDPEDVMPGYNSLIPVSDNTNPYFITKGNIDLLPMERHNFSVNYYYNNPKTNFNTYLWSGGSIANNDVVQSITVDDKGVQTYKPVNANGSKNFSANFNVSKQYKNRQKFIFSWNAGGYYNINESLLIYNSPLLARAILLLTAGWVSGLTSMIKWNGTAAQVLAIISPGIQIIF